MAETKKFLDFTGLQKYDELLKAKVAADIKVVKDDLDTRKVKDTADSDTIIWSKVDGTYTGSVKGVVLDNEDYTAVKNNATQSAAAWTKFLEGITNLYPDNVAPALKDLATTASVTKAVSDGDATTLASAKSYADGLADNYAPASHTHAIADVTGLQTALDGKAAIDHNHDTVYSKLGHNHDDAYDAKGAADGALAAAKVYVNDKVDGKFDAAGAAAQALKDAKKYADDTFDKKGSAESAKTAAISAAKTYTDGEIAKVNETISGINTSIAGGVHFRGVVAELPGTPITGYTNGDIVIVGNKEYILNKPTEGDGEWVELGDTTAESQRITNLEGHVNTLRGDENTTGSVNNAIKVAKSYADGKIDDLVGASGQVGKNTAAINVLNGADTVEGSVAKALKDAKTYADTKKAEANSYTDGEITKLQSSTGQVGINKAAIATLNGNASTEGSVEYKIAQAVSNIEASIETISETDIAGLFK